MTICPIKLNTYKLYIFHNLQIGFRQVRDNFKKLFDAIFDGDCDGLVTKFLNFCVGDFIITLVSIGSFAFCDRTSFDVFLNQFGNLKILYLSITAGEWHIFDPLIDKLKWINTCSSL